MSATVELTEDFLMEMAPRTFGFRENYVDDLNNATKTGLYGYTQSCLNLPEGLKTNGNIVVYSKGAECIQIIYPHTPWNGYIALKRVRFTIAAGWQSWYGVKGEKLSV